MNNNSNNNNNNNNRINGNTLEKMSSNDLNIALDNNRLLMDNIKQSVQKTNSAQICRDFLHNKCKFGDNCKFAHITKDEFLQMGGGDPKMQQEWHQYSEISLSETCQVMHSELESFCVCLNPIAMILRLIMFRLPTINTDSTVKTRMELLRKFIRHHV